MKMQKALTQQQLAKRWHCSPRSVFRHIKAFGLVPFDYMGKTPLFSPMDVERMERRRVEVRNNKHGYAGREAA